MAGFRWAGDLNGHKNPLIKEFLIPAATAIEKGEPVQFTQGTGVVVLPGPTDFDDPIFGVANEAHNGTSGGRQSGTKIELLYSPTAIYRYLASKTYTATGGSTTTLVDSSLLPQTDDFWIGGAIKVVNCQNNSSLNGRIIEITDSTGSTGTLTFAAQEAAFQSGDTYQLVPGEYAEGYVGYDLDSDAMNPDYDANGGETLQFLYRKAGTMESFWRFILHEFANHPNAL